MLQSEFDSYEEWFKGECRGLGFMENDSPGDKEFSQNLKHALEDIFRRREEITLDELVKYIDSIYNPTVKDLMVKLIVLYQDVFKNTDDYQKQLVEDTIKYFNFSDKALLWGRQGIPYNEVKDELERS